LKIGIGRIFSYSDKKQSDAYFLPAMFKKIHQAKLGETLVFSGVNGSRDFLRVGQINQAVTKLAAIQFDGVVNIGTGKGTHLFSAINEIGNILSREDLNLESLSDLPTSHIANTSKLKSLGVNLNSELKILLNDLAQKYAD